MSRRYRSWEERRDIIRSVIAQENVRSLDSFQLTDDELTYFRARSSKAVAALARRSSNFRAYYALPTKKPFYVVVAASMIIVAVAGIAALYLLLHPHRGAFPYSLLGACATVGVAALGWMVAGGITHRNTVRQNTNAILFSRFSQAPFGEALHRFHMRFGFSLSDPVTSERLASLRASGVEDDVRAAAAAVYILNYFESVASGVLHGDLDQQVVRDNVRGLICNYHDMCAPHVREAARRNPRTYANLIKLRTHYREP